MYQFIPEYIMYHFSQILLIQIHATYFVSGLRCMHTGTRYPVPGPLSTAQRLSHQVSAGASQRQRRRLQRRRSACPPTQALVFTRVAR